jgi:hypothetical protein
MHTLLVIVTVLLAMYVLCGLEVALLTRFGRSKRTRQAREAYLTVVAEIGQLRPFLVVAVCWPWILFGVGERGFVPIGHWVLGERK